MPDRPPPPRTGPDPGAGVLPLAVAGQVAVGLLTLLLARSLDLAGFEAYAIAAAAFLMMVTAAPLGAEKLALRVLPPLIDRGDPARVRGYLGWAARRALLGTALAAATGLGWTLLADSPSTTRAAVAASCLGLPAGVLAHLAIEALTAAGQARYATLIFRVVVPGTALALTGALLLVGQPSAVAALLAWGIGWAIAATLMLRHLAAALPPAVRAATPVTEPASWRTAARPLWLYRIATAVMAQAAILALDWLGAPPAAVGAYAAASGVAALALVLATATNRAYAGALALLLERGDFAGIAALHARRLRWLLPRLAVVLAAILGLAPRILGLFRPEFVVEGTLPLRILAIAAAISITFALAPTWLKYRGHNRTLFATLAIAALLQLALLTALVPHNGATGAATAYAVSIAAMYLTLGFIAARDLAALRRTAPLRR